MDDRNDVLENEAAITGNADSDHRNDSDIGATSVEDVLKEDNLP